MISDHKVLKSLKIVNRRSFIAGGCLSLLIASNIYPSIAYANSGFQKWVVEFKAYALKHNISSNTFDIAFKGVTSIDPDVLKKAAYQPEFSDPTWNYFDNRVHDEAVKDGKKYSKKLSKWLNRIENQFGVNRNILLAIWSMETSYGEVMKRDDIMKDAIRSLATLAYADPKRANFARNQLIAAMKILQSGDIDRSHLKGSWAGALGHTQFIPTSYLKYGIDIDGDGRRDIWGSVPDALATAANLLNKNGWQSGKTWGYEVKLPAHTKFPSGSLTLENWNKLGVKRANGKAFPYPKDNAILKLPDGIEGPVFLVTKNFFVIKRYNNSDRYAFAVGLLADQIAGYPGLINDWSRPFTSITILERQEMQTHLKALGFYDGRIDGKIGETSQNAIKSFQQRNKMLIDGHPSRELLLILRKRKS